MTIYEQSVAQDSAARVQQQANAAQLTAYTYVQRTRDAGWRQIAVLFDVTFTDEPAFGYGASLVSVATTGYVPLGNAIVVRWAQDQRGHYTGAVVVVSVQVSAAAAFKFDARLPTGTDPLVAHPVVAHHLTFSGMGLARTKADTTLAMQTLKTASSQIT